LGRRHAARGARSGGTGPFWGCCRRRWAGRATLRSCTWRGMASPSRVSGCLSAPGNRRRAGRTTPAMLVPWLGLLKYLGCMGCIRCMGQMGCLDYQWPRCTRPDQPSFGPRISVFPRISAFGLRISTRGRRDAQGSNTVYAPEYHRRNTVEARERNAECGARNAECGLAVRPGAAGTGTGGSFGAAVSGGRARVLPGLSF